MCELTYYKHRHCQCMWAEISHPCEPFPGMILPYTGFNTCPTFGDGHIKEIPDFFLTDTRLCPWHGMGGQYDRNQVRRVYKVRRGMKIAMRSDDDPCCEIPCVIL